ncbi:MULTISPECIES: LUD domain-containing protein [Shewanella]|uniref:LutC/YkgG family protein n=1 Tax=Shewanella TaxID=22 RepID=UPI000F4F984A|nr:MULTISPECIES: LUD domain-containing protein [Shewanella]MBB1321893.1 LUD domain-containing protein [Shewanella sp. SR43-8]MBB1389695.1 LUD domain-containing protein [Shewanella sp. SG44-6]RPA56751.1 lactate utilization protein B/C [Shewanella vesiculosa]UJL43512.1 LUD domain-containing protein [Shewanella vesiculosa]|tara:strand:- start:4535 stop:5098 length:564 start_codon:yes stop_codon:yes gene_type:complete
MSSKQTILSALSESALDNHAMPEIDVVANNDDLVGQFNASLQSVAATLHTDGGLASLQQAVDDLIKQNMQVISLIEGIKGNRSVPTTAHLLADIDYAVIPGDLGVAENGAIWVNQPSHRVTPFICENLILALSKDNIVANMHQAVKQVSLQQGDLGLFISGPSKTADIEQALVVGAHGACSLNVYLY